MNLLFSVVRAIKYAGIKIKNIFWHWYNLNYCLAANVVFLEKKTVKFNSKGYISIHPQSYVTIGKGFILNSGPTSGIGSTQSKIIVGKGASLNIGNSVGLSSATILCNDSITIGNYVNIGGGSMINDSNYHSLEWRDRACRRLDIKNAKTAPIVIGDYVFIGARCIINKGVTIGEKSIIASGSVVVKDIPPNCIAGGNPCNVIKFLNKDS